jgi:Protein kinase domain
MPNRIGQQLGNYRLLRLLGRGSFAEVYLGEHVYLHRHVALKVLHTSLSDEAVEPFLAEAQMLARLAHPNIVPVFDFAVEDGIPFLVMDYALRGTVLRAHPRGSCLSLATTAAYVKGIASALQYAHNHQVIHRDVKPENLLRGAQQELLLSDFGLALFTPSSEQLSSQEMAGTLPYMAPEQIRGKPDFASDQYALGVVAYEWLTGVRPFEGTPWEVAYQHMTVEPPPLREKDPSLPEAVEAVVLKALAKNTQDRYASVQLFAQTLEQACGRSSSDALFSEGTALPFVISTEQTLTSRQIFLAASPADIALMAHLRADLQQQGAVVWTEDPIGTYETRDQQDRVRQAIRAVDLVALIVSSQTRVSRPIKEYLQIAGYYQRRLVFFWMEGEDIARLLLDAGGRPGGIEVIDAREDRYDEALDELVACPRENAALAEPVVAELAGEPRNPYKGLRPFTQQDAADFFGREALIEELVDRVKTMLSISRSAALQVRLLPVIGASGSGKSSLVMAGLLPCLQQGVLPNSENWIYLEPMVPGLHPLDTLTQRLAVCSPESREEIIREDLEEESARGLHLLARRLVKAPGQQVVLLVDQFEEVLTLTEEERGHFLDLLLTAVTEPQGPVIVLLTLRADFYDRLGAYPALGQFIVEQQVMVWPMEPEELRAVIKRPAMLPDVQLTFEGNLVGDLLFEVQGQVGALPLLQFTLEQLFEQRKGHRLTLAAYREIGGVRGALSQHAERTYAALPSEEHRRLARALFVRLIDPGVSEQDSTRRRAPLSEFSLPDPTQTRLMREVIDTFIAARLLISNEVSGTSTIEVSHEALIREWPRLADWLVTNRNDILLQKAISEDTAEWIRRDRPNDRLYRGSQLTEAQVWSERTIPSVDEVAFLQSGVAAREQEQTERAREEAERAMQKRELSLQRLAARRLRYLSSMAAVTAVVLAVGLIVSLVLYAQLQVSLPASVTNLNDHGPGSLREAIKNASPGSTISFSKNLKGTIALTSGELVINKNLIIAGPGSSLLSISGSEVSRVFNIQEGSTVAIFRVTVTKGRATNAGGGILNNGELTLAESTVSECVSTAGGGIENGGTLTITNSTISGNKADTQGAGIDNSGTLTILRSTVSHNIARLAGGGIVDGYTLSLENSTVAYNRTTSGYGGGLAFGDGGQASIFESTIYGNTATTSGGNIHAYAAPVKLRESIIAGGNAPRGKDILGPVTSFGYGYNLIGTLDGAILRDDGTLPINFIGSSNVGPLQDNGGPTQTIALLPGSPAIDFIPLKFCQSTTDQRGMSRPDGNVPACDIGAYESSGLATATAQANANATAEAAANASPIAYPPHNQSPVLTDPLQDNSKGNNWEVDTSSGDCKFIHRAYDISTIQMEWCPAMATDFTNFIYEVQMKIVTGDGGGIAFRIDPKTEQQYYYFVINQDGSYSISAGGGVAGGGQASDIVLASGSSSAINRGLNQTNLIAAVVHGPVIELYVNLQRVAVVSMVAGSRPPTHGQIGVIVTPTGHHTEIIFQNAEVWRL